MHLSFDELYQQLHKKIYNLVLNYVQRPEDAEEITADVFVDVHQQLSLFRGESSIQTWVYRIAVNRSIDFIRYRNRQKRKSFIVSLFQSKDDGLPLDIPATDHPGIRAEQREDAGILYAAISQLQPNQRHAFILCQVEGMPQKEAAVVLQVTPKAIDSLLQRARANLKKLLEKQYERRGIG